VIGGDGVTNVQQAVSVLDGLDGLGLSLSSLEEWGVLDVGRVLLPVVEFALGGLKSLPHGRSLQDVRVDRFEHLGGNRGCADS